MATRPLRVINYIRERIDLEEYKGRGIIKNDDPIMALRDIIVVEKKDEVASRGLINATDSWLRGVPTAFRTDFETWKQKEFLLQMSSVGKRMMKDDQLVADMYYSVLANRLKWYWDAMDQGKVIEILKKKKENE